MTWFDLLAWFDSLGFVKKWGQLVVISILGATVQMYLSKKQFTFFHYFMGCLVALLCAYSTDALCQYAKLDGDLTTGLIAVSAYSAPHILNAINKVFESLSSDPHGFIKTLLKLRKGI